LPPRIDLTHIRLLQTLEQASKRHGHRCGKETTASLPPCVGLVKKGTTVKPESKASRPRGPVLVPRIASEEHQVSPLRGTGSYFGTLVCELPATAPHPRRGCYCVGAGARTDAALSAPRLHATRRPTLDGDGLRLSSAAAQTTRSVSAKTESTPRRTRGAPPPAAPNGFSESCSELREREKIEATIVESWSTRACIEWIPNIRMRRSRAVPSCRRSLSKRACRRARTRSS
jgi:hypothetical protein